MSIDLIMALVGLGIVAILMIATAIMWKKYNK